MVLLIDNYDSFVHNLARYVRELGEEAVVRRNDAITLDEIAGLAPDHVIISPGPCTPMEAGVSTSVVRRFGATTPILGVCLGHQCIGAAYGGEIVRAGRPMHGKESPVAHDGTGLFTGLPSPLRVARYHSLVIAAGSVPPELRVTATAGDDGEIMAVEHRVHPVVGVQFHPESALSEYGYALIDRFLHGEHSRADALPSRADGASAPADSDTHGESRATRRPPFVPPRSSSCDDGAVAHPPGSTFAGPVVWIDGHRQPPGAAHVSALDRGLTLADGVFETLRVYDGVVFRLGAHLARLERATVALAIELPEAVREMVLAAVASATAEGGGNVGVRLTVTRGASGAGVAPPRTPVALPTVVVTVSALPHFPSQLYDEGISAHVASGRRNERAQTAGLKTLAYTDAVAALIEAQRAGADDALFLDTRDRCSEAASSNLFVSTGDELLTPPASCGALPGITRSAVIELARARGVRVAERAFGTDELFGAREAFLTSSLRELAPLVRVGGRPIGAGQPGPVTRDLIAAYRSLVRQERPG